jgi:hypothetical protein
VSAGSGSRFAVRIDLHKHIKIATVVFAWDCFLAAAILREWWLVLAGFVPYLVWNQVPREDPTSS